MRKPILSLTALDELQQHLSQAQAIIDYVAVDLSVNDEINVPPKTLANVLWAVQTLLDNANKASDNLRIKGGNDEK